eukprot:UN30320
MRTIKEESKRKIESQSQEIIKLRKIEKRFTKLQKKNNENRELLDEMSYRNKSLEDELKEVVTNSAKLQDLVTQQNEVLEERQKTSLEDINSVTVRESSKSSKQYLWLAASAIKLQFDLKPVGGGRNRTITSKELVDVARNVRFCDQYDCMKNYVKSIIQKEQPKSLLNIQPMFSEENDTLCVDEDQTTRDTKLITCPECDGTGETTKIFWNSTCTRCAGTGEIWEWGCSVEEMNILNDNNKFEGMIYLNDNNKFKEMTNEQLEKLNNKHDFLKRWRNHCPAKRGEIITVIKPFHTNRCLLNVDTKLIVTDIDDEGDITAKIMKDDQ